jgi:hypothetical protein
MPTTVDSNACVIGVSVKVPRTLSLLSISPKATPIEATTCAERLLYSERTRVLETSGAGSDHGVLDTNDTHC